ncbi:UMP-CMP kinase 2, mitochondrial isoform X1 [Denticeps clupeoides]|uniref:UMP-CMP kinase 2, mitochondrial n=1 Tax=Denticeps clupeoides TaxID=299321 RepID=A0AAY4ALC6_9TELE|nr:UMP-CMP kinase 2, mitochondrial isoform X1 [Denticeps clupeoides]
MAQRLSRVRSWGSRVFAVECDVTTGPVYFSVAATPQGSGGDVRPLGQLFGHGKVFSLHVHGDDRVRAAKFHGDVKSRLSALPRGHVMEMSSFLPNQKRSLVKGFLMRVPADSSAADDALLELLREDAVHACSYATSGDRWWQQLLARSEEGLVVAERFCVAPAPAPEHHPSTLNIVNSDVFYSFRDAQQVLIECSNIIPESKAVLELVNKPSDPTVKGKFPVIVIEGLDATGKTTLTDSLKGAMGAVLLKSPPQVLAPFRQLFDAEPPLIRRAFYALGNYITARQIARESEKAPVIVDRFWHSTAAYAIATAVSGKVGNLPGLGSEVYQWPGDLLKPSLVLLLSVSPEERLRRLSGRGLEKTVEEAELEANHLFRQKVEEAYMRIQNPACEVVDASPSPDQVLQQVLLLIKSKCHL